MERAVAQCTIGRQQWLRARHLSTCRHVKDLIGQASTSVYGYGHGRDKRFVVRNDHSQVVEGRRKPGFMKQKDIQSIS